jgi:tetrahydromethanopterin S-methyltransferase subunit B
MSLMGDVISGLREVMVIQKSVDQLDKSVDSVMQSLNDLTSQVSAVRDRLSKMEGWIEGASFAATKSKGGVSQFDNLQIPNQSDQ